MFLLNWSQSAFYEGSLDIWEHLFAFRFKFHNFRFDFCVIDSDLTNNILVYSIFVSPIYGDCVSTLENHQRLSDLIQISQNQLKVKLILTNFEWIQPLQGFWIIFYDFWWLSIASSKFQCRIGSWDLYMFFLCSLMIVTTDSVNRNYFDFKNMQKCEKIKKQITMNQEKRILNKSQVVRKKEIKKKC